MFNYGRIDLGERINLAKSNNSKEEKWLMIIVFYYWYFNHGFKS